MPMSHQEIYQNVLKAIDTFKEAKLEPGTYNEKGTNHPHQKGDYIREIDKKLTSYSQSIDSQEKIENCISLALMVYSKAIEADQNKNKTRALFAKVAKAVNVKVKEKGLFRTLFDELIRGLSISDEEKRAIEKSLTTGEPTAAIKAVIENNIYQRELFDIEALLKDAALLPAYVKPCLKLLQNYFDPKIQLMDKTDFAKNDAEKILALEALIKKGDRQQILTAANDLINEAHSALQNTRKNTYSRGGSA